MKVDIENVELTLQERKVDPIKIKEILRDLEAAAEEEKEDRKASAGPKPKWEYVIVLSDPEGKLKDSELSGWVVQQQDGQDANLVLSKLADAAKVQNEGAKRKKSLINDMLGLFESLKPKWLKEKGLKIKTKHLTRVILSDGKLR